MDPRIPIEERLVAFREQLAIINEQVKDFPHLMSALYRIETGLAALAVEVHVSNDRWEYLYQAIDDLRRNFQQPHVAPQPPMEQPQMDFMPDPIAVMHALMNVDEQWENVEVELFGASDSESSDGEESNYFVAA